MRVHYKLENTTKKYHTLGLLSLIIMLIVLGMVMLTHF